MRASLDPAPTLFARLLCVVPFHAVASPDYLARVGVAADATRLAGLDLIVPSYLSPEKLAHMRAATARTAMRSDNSALTYQAVLAGIGVAVLPDWIVADDIASGRLKVLRINPAPPDIPLHAVYVSRRQVAPKLRSFIDFFARRFGAQVMSHSPARNDAELATSETIPARPIVSRAIQAISAASTTTTRASIVRIAGQ